MQGGAGQGKAERGEARTCRTDVGRDGVEKVGQLG